MTSPPVVAARALIDADQPFDMSPHADLAGGDQSPTSVFSSFAEAAFLVARGDGHISGLEAAGLANVLVEVSAGALDRSTVAGMIYHYATCLEEQGVDARIVALARRNADPAARRRLLRFACIVAISDRDFSEAECAVYYKLAAALGIDQPEAARIADALSATMEAASSAPSPDP
jgi:tellurite resistance protein